MLLPSSRRERGVLRRMRVQCRLRRARFLTLCKKRCDRRCAWYMLLLLCIVACLAGAASGVGLRRLAAAKNASTTKPYSWPTDFFDCFDPAERLWAAQQHPSPLPVAPSQPQSSQSSQPPLFSSFNCMNGEVRGCQLAHHATQSNNARLPFFSFKVYFSWLFGRLGAS